MAIQRGGPPRSPAPPGTRTAGPERAEARGEAKGPGAAKAAAKGAPRADAFEAPGNDAGRSGSATEAPPRARAPAVAGARSPALVQQSLDRLEREIREREAELSRLVAVVAREGFAREVAARHAKTLAALRKKLAEARARATKARRALGEIERGAERVPSSRLGRLDSELSALEGEADDGKRALAALLLTMEVAAEEPVRRLAVRSADKVQALAYAESESPSTLLADLAAAAADGFAPAAASPDAPDPEEGALGKALDGQRRLGALTAGRRRRAR